MHVHRPTTPPPAPGANHTRVVRRDLAVAALAFLLGVAVGCFGLGPVFAAMFFLGLAAAVVSGLWQSRHEFLVEEFAEIDRRHELNQALRGGR